MAFGLVFLVYLNFVACGVDGRPSGSIEHRPNAEHHGYVRAAFNNSLNRATQCSSRQKIALDIPNQRPYVQNERVDQAPKSNLQDVFLCYLTSVNKLEQEFDKKMTSKEGNFKMRESIRDMKNTYSHINREHKYRHFQTPIHIVENVSISRILFAAMETFAQNTTEEIFIDSIRQTITFLCHTYNAAIDWLKALQPPEGLLEELERTTEAVHEIARNMVESQWSESRAKRLPNVKYLLSVLPGIGHRIKHRVCDESCSRRPLTALACNYS